MWNWDVKTKAISRLNLVKNTNFLWEHKQLFLSQWKTVFWVTDHLFIKWTFPKNAIFCPKNAFFWQKCNIYPCPTSSNFDVKKLFIPLVFIYFNSEGFVGGGWRRWWNPPLNIFNLAKNGPFLEVLKTKSFQKPLEPYT